MARHTVVAVLVTALAVSPAFAGKLYKWVDAAGNVSYQDRPPPEGQGRVEERDVRGSHAAGGDPATDDAKAPVTLYMVPGCSSCDAASAHLKQRGIPFSEVNVAAGNVDDYLCPAGQILRKRNFNKERQYYEYKASGKVCAECELYARCTKAKDGRSLKRHLRQDEVDRMLEIASSAAAKRDIKTRQHLSERSFARSTRYGYKRARWRGLWRMQIQDFLIAAVQNIQILIQKTGRRVTGVAQVAAGGTKSMCTIVATVLLFLFGFSTVSRHRKVAA